MRSRTLQLPRRCCQVPQVCRRQTNRRAVRRHPPPSAVPSRMRTSSSEPDVLRSVSYGTYQDMLEPHPRLLRWWRSLQGNATAAGNVCGGAGVPGMRGGGRGTLGGFARPSFLQGAHASPSGRADARLSTLSIFIDTIIAQECGAREGNQRVRRRSGVCGRQSSRLVNTSPKVASRDQLKEAGGACESERSACRPSDRLGCMPPQSGRPR